ncbi:MAG: hypothetical protein COB67_05565 [SAR324 cluster bacterium]|uniref:M23ase beta-sheet core domain-containing protein n=1 Tax=SAR324 cluster bacterium TaxID=2024889 RepID=A0A2A4T5L4_9DELT|nr:MAG: hypothetical protein COB67_05565 [SAR324 cluster bacterium]
MASIVESPVLRNYLTVLVIPQKEGNILRFRISAFLLKFFSLIVIIVSLISIGIFYDYLSIRQQGQELAEIEKKLRLQTFDFQAVNNRLSQKWKELKTYEEFDQQLRLISGLQDSIPEIQYVGKINNNLRGQDTTSFDGEQVLGVLKQLDLDVKIREISYFQLEASLQESKDRLLRTPSIRPTSGYQSSAFGVRADPFTRRKKFHKGVDWASRPYTPIYAPADGIVVNAYINGGFGKFLVLDHGYNTVTRYGHLIKFEVTVGQQVKRGDLIARMGNTGRSTASHLHYEVLVRDQYVNPMKYVLE